jgi:hypothetical protein
MHGGVELQLHYFLSSALENLCSVSHTYRSNPRKECRRPFHGKLRGPQIRSGPGGENKNLPRLESNPDRLARSLVTAMSQPSQFPLTYTWGRGRGMRKKLDGEFRKV